MKKAINIILSILILAGGYMGWKYMINKPPEKNIDPAAVEEKKRRQRKKEQGQQTLAKVLKPQNYPVSLETQGSVRPAIVTSLTPRVAGRITDEIPEQFSDGAFFKKGDILLKLDTTDLKSEIINAQANYARAFSTLEQEKARAAQALRNWEDIGFEDEPNELVLRKPQLAEAEANLAAQAEALARAERNLTHANIRAPFDGRVRTRLVGPGQTVNTSTPLGEIFTTDSAKVRIPLSTRQLSQIQLKEESLQEIDIELSNALQIENPTRWPATIVRIEGELDEISRELFVIATIPDPFGLKTDHPPLLINQPVKAHIAANIIKNVVIIPRTALHGSNEVILITEDFKVKRQTINIIWTTQDSVIADNPELHNTTLALSKLSYAPEGSPIRIIPAPEPTEQNTQANAR